MIGRIQGKVLEKQPPSLIIDVGGVGYEIDAPMSTFYRLPDIGQEVILHTHFVVREDAQLLFGFYDREERALFRTLIKVNGVGPKMALGILSGIESADFVRCVQQQDTQALVKLPGVGKKTAERLVVEMRDRLPDLAPKGPLSSAGRPIPQRQFETQSPVADAESALIALGYKPTEATKVIAALATDGLRSEDIIRQALKSMVNP